MEELLHLGCKQPCKWDQLPSSSGEFTGCLNHQAFLVTFVGKSVSQDYTLPAGLAPQVLFEGLEAHVTLRAEQLEGAGSIWELLVAPINLDIPLQKLTNENRHILLKMGGIGTLQCHVSVQRCFGEFGNPLRPCPHQKKSCSELMVEQKNQGFPWVPKNRQFRKQSKARIGLETCLSVTHFSPTAFWEGTGFREPVPVTGLAVPGNQFRESGPGFDGFRQALRFQGSGFSFSVARNRVPDPRHCQRSGSEGCVPEVSKVLVFDGFRRVRFCSRGLDGAGSGNRVPGTRGII